MNDFIVKIMILLKKICFSSPGPCEVVVYDRNMLEILNRTVFHDCDYDYGLIYTRPFAEYEKYNVSKNKLEHKETFYISPAVLYRMFCNLRFFFCGANGLLPRSFIRKIPTSFLVLQRLACIEMMNPKIIISYNDHAHQFYLLAKLFPRIHFIMMQHGALPFRFVRNIRKENMIASHSVNNVSYYVHGDYIKQYYKRCGYNTESLIEQGSVVLSKAMTEYVSDELRTKNDICIISEYRESLGIRGVRSNQIPWDVSFEHHFTNIAKYITENNLTCCVALRTHNLEEREYFKEKLGDNVTFFKSYRDEFSAYNAIFSSKVIISTASTMGIESLGLGKRVLIYEMYDSHEASIYTNYLDETCNIYTKNKDYQSYKKKLDYLFSVSDQKYRQEIKEIRHYYMNQCLEYPLYKRIQNQIQEIVEK